MNTYKVSITGYQLAENAGDAKMAYVRAVTGKDYISDDKGGVHTELVPGLDGEIILRKSNNGETHDGTLPIRKPLAFEVDSVATPRCTCVGWCAFYPGRHHANCQCQVPKCRGQELLPLLDRQLEIEADMAASKKPHDFTLRELQTQLPWTTHYHRDFRTNPQTHKDFQHALAHVMKSVGRIFGVINEAEHAGIDWERLDTVPKWVADLVVCALRMANTYPGRTIDLQREVQDRINESNETQLRSPT